MCKYKLFLPSLTVLISFILISCGSNDSNNHSNAENSTIHLSFLSRYETNTFDESAAEIVAFDPTTQQIFVVNAGSGMIDILDISVPSTPVLIISLTLSHDIANAVTTTTADALGAANSVSIKGNTVAVAVEAKTKQDNGYVAFYQTDGTFVSALEVGALPDMVTFTPDGHKVLVANEGEPNSDYSNDPEGSISVIDIRAGAATVTQSDVTTLSFTDFNRGGSRAAELDDDIRVSNHSASAAQDFEPEYIAVSKDSSKAWVTMQENNAIAELDLSNKSITTILGLGFKDHTIATNALDASNRDDGINIKNWPLRGLYMPDAIDVFESNNINYLVTANEGDAREYLTDEVDATACTAAGGFEFDEGDCLHYLDEIRLKDIEDTGATIALTKLTDYAATTAELAKNENLGRIKIVANMGVTGCTVDTLATTGQPSTGCTYENLYSYGARSFTIWNAETGALVFDSGSDFETITAEQLGNGAFNATNDENGADDRSDDKGPEPEAIEIATIGNKTYAFIGLERVSAIMVYDITTPESARFIQVISTRDHTVDIESLVDAGDFTAAGDLGPESLLFVAAKDSPNNEALLIVGNEVSGTTAIFQVEESMTK